MNSSLVDIDYYLPSLILTNEEIVEKTACMDASALYRATGVKTRRIAGVDEAPSDMAYLACKKLLARQTDAPKRIGALIFCSHIPDSRSPTTAALLHGRLQLPATCLSIDVPGGCAGFTNAMLLANSIIAAGQATHVLILTAETTSKTIPENDHVLMSIFGDGAAAALIAGTTNKGIGRFCTGTDSSGSSSLSVTGGGARDPLAFLPFGRLQMNGADLLRFALKRVPCLLEDVLVSNCLKRDDIDLFIFHQASAFILSALKKKCNIADERFLTCLEDVGNTVSSTIPITLARAKEAGRIRPGMRLMLLGFGVGYAWSGTVITWPDRVL
jgi:3-oxoacyl-[acyl-carrier-protein] synthase III